VCDSVVSTVCFSLLKLAKFSFLFLSYLLLVFITPVNKDYQNKCTATQSRNKKLKSGLVASYDIQPENGEAYSGFGAS